MKAKSLSGYIVFPPGLERRGSRVQIRRLIARWISKVIKAGGPECGRHRRGPNARQLAIITSAFCTAQSGTEMESSLVRLPTLGCSVFIYIFCGVSS